MVKNENDEIEKPIFVVQFLEEVAITEENLRNQAQSTKTSTHNTDSDGDTD